jgi:cell division protein FtsB
VKKIAKLTKQLEEMTATTEEQKREIAELSAKL